MVERENNWETGGHEGELVEVKRDKEKMFKIRRKRRCGSLSKRGKDIRRNCVKGEGENNILPSAPSNSQL